MFESAEIGIPCPGCGHKTPKTVAWIKANDTLICGGCGSTIRLEREELLAGLKKVDESIDNIRRQLRDIGKGFKI